MVRFLSRWSSYPAALGPRARPGRPDSGSGVPPAIVMTAHADLQQAMRFTRYSPKRRRRVWPGTSKGFQDGSDVEKSYIQGRFRFGIIKVEIYEWEGVRTRNSITLIYPCGDIWEGEGLVWPGTRRRRPCQTLRPSEKPKTLPGRSPGTDANGSRGSLPGRPRGPGPPRTRGQVGALGPYPAGPDEVVPTLPGRPVKRQASTPARRAPLSDGRGGTLNRPEPSYPRTPRPSTPCPPDPPPLTRAPRPRLRPLFSIRTRRVWRRASRCLLYTIFLSPLSLHTHRPW